MIAIVPHRRYMYSPWWLHVYSLVWTIVLSTAKAMREACQLDKTIDFHTFPLKNASTWESGGIDNIMFGPSFSSESKNKIQNIGNILNKKFRSQGFEVSVYFSGSGTYSIDLIYNGCIINKFLFSAAYDNSGEIDSIAIYGNDLPMYQRNISMSNSIFGLPVDRVETDCGNEPFLDVYLER